jgi:hypothetical protein
MFEEEKEEKKPLLKKGLIQALPSSPTSSIISAGYSGYHTYDLYGDPQHPESKAWLISRASFSYIFPLLWVFCLFSKYLS